MKKKNLQNQEFKFDFLEGRFNWKELMKINTNYIERTSDMSTLYPYLPNILYTKLNLQNIDLLSEEYIIQLVTLLQLTGQHLIYNQKKKEDENNELKANINKLKSDIIDNEKFQMIIDDLQRQNQENEMLIKSYQEMIQNEKYRNKNNDEDDKNIYLENVPEKNYIAKTYYYCNICVGKKFKTQKYLDDHMKRRHYNQKGFFSNREIIEEEKIEKDNYHLDFENKLNTMRNEFMDLINLKEENDEYALLNKKLDLLQTQIISHNYSNIINYKSNTTNTTNYFELNKFNKNIENKNKTEIELKIKFDELNKKYKDLLQKFEETKKINIEFNRQPTHIEEKNQKLKEENKENNLNKILKIDFNKIIIEIKPDKNKINNEKANINKEKQIIIDKNKENKEKLEINRINVVDEEKKEKKKKNILEEKNEKDKIILD